MRSMKMTYVDEAESLEDYREYAITAAKDLRYPKTVIAKLYIAKTVVEIERIMTTARKDLDKNDEMRKSNRRV